MDTPFSAPVSKLPNVGTTIFTTMSQLAAQTGAIEQETAKAPEEGNSAEAQRRIEAWQRQIFAHIVRFKRYPEEGRAKRLNGETLVAFSLGITDLDPLRFALLFAIGLILGWARVHRNNTTTSIVAHMTNNMPGAIGILFLL